VSGAGNPDALWNLVKSGLATLGLIPLDLGVNQWVPGSQLIEHGLDLATKIHIGRRFALKCDILHKLGASVKRDHPPTKEGLRRQRLERHASTTHAA
jgi:hypothetical protein